MTSRHTLACAAALLALAPLPFDAAAQAAAASAPPSTPVAKAASKARLPTDWIRYTDGTYTPVLDDVSRHLAAARAALAAKDKVKAAEAMRSAARALDAQADRAAQVGRQRAVADRSAARQTHHRMVELSRKLYATARQIEAGKVTTIAALDKTLGKAARADLERRWLVTDASSRNAVADEPQRHFGAAAEAYAKKDFEAAATQVRQGAAYVRLESARAVGDVKKGLDAADADLERTAHALDQGALKTAQDMHDVFAKADHALALAHRAQAAESWARKVYDQAGYELKAAAHGLDSAAGWTGAEARAAAASAAADARAVGDKLARGGVWAKDEVASGFESLGVALNKLGHSIGSKYQASPFDVGA